MAGVRTSKQRVLRLMRQHGLLAPERQLQPSSPSAMTARSSPNGPTRCEHRRDGGFYGSGRPGGDLRYGPHDAADSLSIHAAKRGTRLEALGPVRQAAQEYFGGFGEAVAAGVQLWDDHGVQFILNSEVDLL
jgi:hypothetical protein